MITGLLTDDSPLRKAFPRGIVPLQDLHGRPAVLGEGTAAITGWIYLLDPWRCDDEQRAALAALVAAANGCTEEEARTAVAADGGFPIQAKHIQGVGADWRLFT